MTRRILRGSMLSQVLLLLGVAGVIILIAGVLGGYLLQRPPSVSPSRMIELMSNLAVAKLNDTPADLRPALLREIRRTDPFLQLEMIPEEALPVARDTLLPRRTGSFELGETLFGIRLEYAAGGEELPPGAPPVLYFRLGDGALVRAVLDPVQPPLPPFTLEASVVFFVGFGGLAFAGLMIWAAQGIVRPLGDLAKAAENFGRHDMELVPIPEAGPGEVRAAAAAFNRMQRRITEFVETRTRTLAAISHDLRTPLTRLRLRLDLLDAGEIRDRSLADVGLMDQQISQALVYLKGGGSAEPAALIDLQSLLQSITDQYADTGLAVVLTAEVALTVEARPNDLIRAISNVIDNANHYADGAEILLTSVGPDAQIDIADHGPGIAARDKERLLKPFERGDQARQIGEKTGFGLGLATSKAIVEATRGSLELLDTAGGGLTVRIRIPRADTAIAG